MKLEIMTDRPTNQPNERQMDMNGHGESLTSNYHDIAIYNKTVTNDV